MSGKTINIRYLTWFLFSVCILISNIAISEVLILSPNNPQAKAIAEKIKLKLQNKNVVISDNPDAVLNPELVITLGSKLLREHTSNLNAPTLASFVSPSEYEASKIYKSNSDAVFSVVSPSSLMDFLSKTFGRTRVGYIYTGEKGAYISELEIISSYSKAKIVPVKLEGDVFKTIRRLISKRSIDAMLISNDNRVFNRKNIRFVLEALYRKKIPTVGFSKNLVDAGAVAAVFSEEDALIEKTIAVANTYLITNTFEQGMYASITSVVYKKSFAEEFNIKPIGNYSYQ